MGICVKEDPNTHRAKLAINLTNVEMRLNRLHPHTVLSRNYFYHRVFPLMFSCLCSSSRSGGFKIVGGWSCLMKKPSYHLSPNISLSWNLFCTSRTIQTLPFYIVRNTARLRGSRNCKEGGQKKNGQDAARCSSCEDPGPRSLIDHEAFNLCELSFWFDAAPHVLPPAGLGPVCQQQQGQR